MPNVFFNPDQYVVNAGSFGLGAAQAQRDSAANLASSGKISQPQTNGMMSQMGNIAFAATPFLAGNLGAKKQQNAWTNPDTGVKMPTGGIGSFLNSNVVNPLDQFGSSMGFATPNATSGLGNGLMKTGAGNSGSGFLGGSGTLTGVLSGAGAGYGIGSANLFGGNEKGSQIGGTIGGAIGSYFLPGIGGYVGGAVGSAIGGLFGPGKGNVWSGFNFTAGNKETLGGTPTFDSKRTGAEIGQGIYKDFGGYLESVQDKFNVDFTGAGFHGGYNQKYGGYTVNSGGNSYSFDPENADSVNTAYTNAAIAALKQKGTYSKEMEDQIRGFNYKQYQGQLVQDKQTALMATQNRSATGIPLVGGRTGAEGQSFSSFLDTYKASKAPTTAV